jgi:hypothetical protein
VRDIIDGTLQPDLRQWSSERTGSVALKHNLHGQVICPMCAESDRVEVLFLVSVSQRYACARRHLFAMAATPDVILEAVAAV